MSELRWILLGAGLALIAGLYLWGVRSRRRSAASEPGRAMRFEAPPPTEPVESLRIEPQVRLAEEAPRVHEVVPVIELGDDLQPGRAHAAGRREPTLGQRLTAPAPARQVPSGAPWAEPEEPAESRTGGMDTARAASESAQDPETETAVTARAQRIVAIRVAAPSPSRFEGSLLHEAVIAEGFAFGHYQIFHRLDPVGRPLMSLASLREPGTFDPETMAGAAYAGVAVFVVLPGPLPAQQAFEELMTVARSLAGRIGGNLHDDRGTPLTVQRIAQLREDMLAFDRGRAARPGR
jgi:cell division protein ZipA